MLEVKGLCKYFGGIRAVDDCSFRVERGSITALIGPNGAGKTTAFNCISRTMMPTKGEVWLDGERIDRLRPHKITAKGLGRTFQISRNLADMTVLENVICQNKIHGWRDMMKPAMSPAEIDKAMEILDFLNITRIAYEDGSNLSYGQKKLMDLAALLMSDPKIILLDEPAAGLNSTETKELQTLLEKVSTSGTTLLVVEHDMNFVRNLCQHVVVLNFGKKIFEGTPDAVAKDPQVLEAYLGGDDNNAP